LVTVPRERPPMPWEDTRESWTPKVLQSTNLGDVAQSLFANQAELDRFIALWSSTRNADLWSKPIGKAMAHFAAHRYGGAVTRYGMQKFTHAAEVLWFSDTIAAQQEKRGSQLSGHWRELLEYAAFLHDIGYMNGGYAHSGKGGRDILFNLLDDEPELKQRFSQVDAEKMALLVELHGKAFPWDRVDPRLPGGHYVDLRVVDQILDAAALKRLATAMREENDAYLRGKEGDGKLAWILHSADAYLGDLHPADNPLEQRARPVGVRELGQHTPLASVKQLEKYLRDQAARESLVRCRLPDFQLARVLDPTATKPYELVDDILRLRQRAGVTAPRSPEQLAQALVDAGPTLEQLRRLVGSANMVIDGLAARVTDSKSGALASDLADAMTDPRWLADMQKTIAAIDPDVGLLIEVCAPGFLDYHQQGVGGTVNQLAALPDIVVDDLKA
jgi:hypothetical protein